jgi:purine-cytosine permease-like protein
MPELLLVILFVAVLLLVVFGFSFLPQPLRTYLSVIISLALLVLIWVKSEPDRKGMKFVFTIILISGIVRTIGAYRRERKASRPDNQDKRLS